MHWAILALSLLSSAASLEIACGGYQNCVFEKGTTAMKCWGLNNYGQLGYDDNNNRGDETNEMGSNLPFVNIGSNFIIQEVSLGIDHSCGISGDKAMKCFGRNQYSQLGFSGSTTTGDALPFLDFGPNTNVSKVAAGREHTCALATNNVLKCFGHNNYEQCGAGINDTTISGPPSQISAINLGTNFTAIDVRSTWNHVCVLAQQGTLKCFGWNTYGQLGYGDTTDRGQTPESMGDGLPTVNLGSDFIVKQIDTGFLHSCALSTMKTVKCWGCATSNYGQCGTPHSTETGDDLPVLDLGSDFVPMQLALGGHHTCILSENATMKCFGDNRWGQLGLGSQANTGTPSILTSIDLGSNFMPRQIGAGWRHTCAVSTNDDIKCWGNNYSGQLGLGHTDDMGDEANEMGDNLPSVDVGSLTTAPSSQPTVFPSSSPTTTRPTTSPPSTSNPSTSNPTTSVPSTLPVSITAISTTEPTTESPIQATIPLADLSTTHTVAHNNTVTVTIGTDASDETPQPAGTTNVFGLHWLVIVALCIGSVCLCGVVVAVIKCMIGKTRRHPHGHDAQHIDMPVRSLPVVPKIYAMDPESDTEEKRDDIHAIQPGAGGPDLASTYQSSMSNRAEGLRASVAAPSAFEVVEDNNTTAGLEDDEFEVVEDVDAVTAGHTSE